MQVRRPDSRDRDRGRTYAQGELENLYGHKKNELGDEDIAPDPR